MEQNTSGITFPGDPIQYLSPSWQQLTDHCFALSDRLSAQPYDLVVSLAKGGWALSRLFSDCARVRELYSLGIKFYTGINTQADAPCIYQDIDHNLVNGKTVLLFDDVADTGHSLQFAQEHLKALGAEKVVSAVIYYKPHSVFYPDYFCAETTDWVIFPFEIYETFEQLGKRWDSFAIPKEEQDRRLASLGFLPEWISKYRREIDRRT